VALGVAGPASASSTPHCLRQGDDVQAKTHLAVIFDRTVKHGHGSGSYTAKTMFGCLRAVGRKVQLGIDDDDLAEYSTHPKLAGKFAGIASVSCDGAGESCSTDVKVWNLETRKRVHRAEAVDDPSKTNLFDVRSLVLKHDGSVAWIAKDGDNDTYEVHKLDKDGAATLATGSDINGASLRLHGSDLSWKQGGTKKHATLR
jgi:hypothetical protein